ncbi:thioredoxin [Methanosarcinales archaeon]|nr:MAG: thioredoxin [Methanosarcinales archaeon]
MEEKELEIEITDANFKQEVLESEIPCLVDFWAPWCGPCQMIGPIVKEIAQKYQGKIKVCKLNVDDAKQTALEYKVMGIPSLIVFKDGKETDKVVGAVPKSAVESMIKPLLKDD